MKTKDYFVHESSYVDMGCKIGNGTKIWHFSHIQSGSNIGEECSIGQNVNIGNNVKINGCAQLEEKETDTYFIKEGIVVVKKGAVIPDGYEI